MLSYDQPHPTLITFSSSSSSSSSNSSNRAILNPAHQTPFPAASFSLLNKQLTRKPSSSRMTDPEDSTAKALVTDLERTSINAQPEHDHGSKMQSAPEHEPHYGQVDAPATTVESHSPEEHAHSQTESTSENSRSNYTSRGTLLPSSLSTSQLPGMTTEHDYFTPQETTRSTHESEHQDGETSVLSEEEEGVETKATETHVGDGPRRRSGSTVSASALAAAVSALPPMHPTPVSSVVGTVVEGKDGEVVTIEQTLPPPSHLAPLPPSSSLPSTELASETMPANTSADPAATATTSTIMPSSSTAAEGMDAGVSVAGSSGVPPPSTETIDPVASYSAWRKKKDTETSQGTQAVMEVFLKQHSAYDVLPVSYRQIVLDTTLLVKKALSVLMQYSKD